VQGPGVLVSVASDSFTLAVTGTGPVDVRVRFTPYWAIAGGHGCVSRAPGDWTRVRARGPGALRVAIRFSLGRIFNHGPRCA